MHQGKYLKQGVLVNGENCIMCGKSIRERSDRIHVEEIMLVDGAKVQLKIEEEEIGYYAFGCGHCCHVSCLDET